MWIILFLLLVVACTSFPGGPLGSNWGWYPSGGLGLVVLILLILLLLGKL